VYVITKSAILISEYFSISSYYSFMVQTQITVSLCLTIPRLFDCRILHTIVYCEAVRSAILATAWLLVAMVSLKFCLFAASNGFCVASNDSRL